MGAQAEAFLEGEGDAFHERNLNKPRLPDPVVTAIRAAGLQPTKIFEVGCGEGLRLRHLQSCFPEANVWGIEASSTAVNRGRKQGIDIYCNAYPIGLSSVQDLVIFGFCLYVMDRDKLFETVLRADESLKDGGHIIIHDFVPDYPYRRAYEHKAGLWSYKMDYSKLWLAHPGYKLIRQDLFGEGDERTGVTVIQKDFVNAFPVREI